jgi:hypothetical protein
MATMNTAEKIETIVLCFLKDRTTAGTFGSLTPGDDGRFTVQADGRTFTVGTDRLGWHVAAGHFTAHASDLYEAAADAISAAAGR